MSEVIHRYVGKGQSVSKPVKESKEKAEARKWDVEFRRERAAHEKIRRIEREANLARMRGELISRDEAQRQASYLVTELRQKMLLLPARISHKLDLDAPLRHKTKLELDAAIHAALDEFSQLPDVILQSGYDHYRAERAENGKKQSSEPRGRKLSR